MRPDDSRNALAVMTSAALAALVLYVGAGCIRVPAESEKNKIVTQLISATANGLTILRWESRSDLIYTILVANRLSSSEWKPLENGVNLRGTGEAMELRIPENPSHPRTYKLMAVPLHPPKR
jgi:hypothetical protein